MSAYHLLEIQPRAAFRLLNHLRNIFCNKDIFYKDAAMLHSICTKIRTFATQTVSWFWQPDTQVSGCQSAKSSQEDCKPACCGLESISMDFAEGSSAARGLNLWWRNANNNFHRLWQFSPTVHYKTICSICQFEDSNAVFRLSGFLL
jgi:hypothetical protein